jgi:Zn-dependent protease with chaperone function
MSWYWMLEAALRSLVMGAAIFATLKVLRVRQVRAQRIAWVLALLAAIAMPALVRWPIAMRLPAVHLPLLTAAPPSSKATLPDVKPDPMATVSEGPLAAPIQLRSTPSRQPDRSRASSAWAYAGRYTLLVYLIVTPLLLVRLAIGLGLTWRLLRRAAPAYLQSQSDIRISDGIRTPVTIGSTIVLPTYSAQWDPAKLNVVLAHERAHVENADFYVQLLASVHCAIFWFSPFSWWLQRKLAALGEALGDLAALQQAESRSSYAEVLLEFATSVRQPIAAVAMARAGGLRPRIERLLNDRLFREAFTETRRHPYLAASVVPIALLVSASVVRIEGRRVQAAEVHPSRVVGIAPSALQVTAPAPSPTETLRGDQAKLIAESQADSAREDKVRAEADASREQAEVDNAGVQEQSATEIHSGYSDGDRDGDSFALMYGDGKVTFNGDYNDHVSGLRQKVKGDFIYYSHAGKSYVITDPSLIAQAKALYAPMEALGKQQEALGRQQEALGKQQEALGRKQEAVNVPTPDFTKELERLSEVTAKMKALQASKTVDEQTLAELQEKMGDIQGRLGDLQGAAGEQQGKFGDEQGKLGEQQGKLGEEQGRLGEMQGKLAEEANHKLKPMIEKAVREGLAKQVD